VVLYQPQQENALAISEVERNRETLRYKEQVTDNERQLSDSVAGITRNVPPPPYPQVRLG